MVSRRHHNCPAADHHLVPLSLAFIALDCLSVSCPLRLLRGVKTLFQNRQAPLVVEELFIRTLTAPLDAFRYMILHGTGCGSSPQYRQFNAFLRSGSFLSSVS